MKILEFFRYVFNIHNRDRDYFEILSSMSSYWNLGIKIIQELKKFIILSQRFILKK